jgi:hypothetical protein
LDVATKVVTVYATGGTVAAGVGTVGDGTTTGAIEGAGATLTEGDGVAP